jgi:hypothetical protein
MKKTYMKPNALVVKVETQQFIALSRFNEEASQNGVVLSRQGRFSADDDWDEE